MGLLGKLFGGGGTSASIKCAACGDELGPLPSFGGARGGYRCNQCGAVSCGPCSKSKGVERNRMTMLCARCGSDQVNSFRV
jgi:DNA-directed RNA polymerase subunit RPC12/RpoP